jgi:hypothetical protein
MISKPLTECQGENRANLTVYQKAISQGRRDETSRNYFFRINFSGDGTKYGMVFTGGLSLSTEISSRKILG